MTRAWKPKPKYSKQDEETVWRFIGVVSKYEVEKMLRKARKKKRASRALPGGDGGK